MRVLLSPEGFTMNTRVSNMLMMREIQRGRTNLNLRKRRKERAVLLNFFSKAALSTMLIRPASPVLMICPGSRFPGEVIFMYGISTAARADNHQHWHSGASGFVVWIKSIADNFEG